MRQRRKKTNNKGKIYTLLTLFSVGFFLIVFNESGLRKLITLKREQVKLEKAIGNLQRHQIKLNNEIHELKTNTLLVEKIAREKFMMAKPGEKVFKVVHYKTVE